MWNEREEQKITISALKRENKKVVELAECLKKMGGVSLTNVSQGSLA